MGWLFSSFLNSTFGEHGFFDVLFSFVGRLFKPLLGMFSESSEPSGFLSHTIDHVRNNASSAVHAASGAAREVVDDIGDGFHKTGEWIHGQWDKLGRLFTNPGNVRATDRRQQQEGGFRKPDTPEEGFKIMAKLLYRYQMGPRHLQTIRQIINVYSPPGDHNPLDAYIEHVTQWTGFDADQHLNLGDPDVLASLMKAMTRQEKGAKVASHYSDDSILEAAKAAINSQGAHAAPVFSEITLASVQGHSLPLQTPSNPCTKIELW